MDSLRLDTLAGHLVAWHNSHRLARRITVAHVTSVGYVVLPFAPEPMAGAAPAPLRPPQAPPVAAPGLAAPVAADEADVPLEVLIGNPDIDLASVRGLALEATGLGAVPQELAQASADAPVDIAFDATLSAAAAPQPPAPPTAAVPPPRTDPVADPRAGATLRERAMARAPTPGHAAPAAAPAPALRAPAAQLKPLFSEDFIPPLKPDAVAEFALRHGAAYASPGKGGLVRVINPDPGMAVPVVEKRWLLTAQIDIGGQRTRLLVGAGPNPAVMGQRLGWLPRLAMFAGPPLLVAAAAASWWWPEAPLAPAKAAAPAPLAGVAHAASAVIAARTASAASAALAPAAGPSASASAPVDVEPTLGRVELPSLGPIVDERRRAAATVAEAKSAAAARTAIEQVQKSVPPPAVVGPAFAVSTRLLRTRTESEQLAEAMRALLAGTGPPGLQVQALRSGDDWRVVVWPFTEQAEAEKARALLVSRGMKVAVIDF